MNDLTIVIPTQGRSTLPRCLESMRPEHHGGYQAEVLVVADTYSPLLMDVEAVAREYGAAYREWGEDRHNWGYPQLAYGYLLARGDYIMNIGDDDVYESGAFEVVRAAIAELDQPTPLLFRALMHPSVSRPCGNPLLLWGQRGLLQRSRVTGQNLICPNIPGQIGVWIDDFIQMEHTISLHDGRVMWRDEVIARCY